MNFIIIQQLEAEKHAKLSKTDLLKNSFEILIKNNKYNNWCVKYCENLFLGFDTYVKKQGYFKNYIQGYKC